MTREQILAMQPGRELDAMVAEKVMGWIPKQTGVDFGRPLIDWYRYNGDGTRLNVKQKAKYFHPSTDISAAWEVVERFEYRKMSRYEDGDNYLFVLGNFDNEAVLICAGASAETAPLAICRAALLATLTEVTYDRK